MSDIDADSDIGSINGSLDNEDDIVEGDLLENPSEPNLAFGLFFKSSYLTIPAATVSFVASSTRIIDPVTLLTV